jgi:hypothetical protein
MEKKNQVAENITPAVEVCFPKHRKTDVQSTTKCQNKYSELAERSKKRSRRIAV